jgi:hypothetical protein
VAQTASAPSSPKKKAATLTVEDVQALRDAIASQQAALAQQQKQIQELRDELRQRDQTVQQAQTAASDAAGKADAAQAQATQQQETVTALKSDVTDLKSNMANTALTLQETQKNVNASLESPTALHFKGVTITPGGFLAAESVYRTRALGADINTPFNSVTMPGASASNMSEFFGSGRQSRVSMLVEGKLKAAKLTGYVEGDFLSAGVTSNNNQSNSYTFRQRQAWGQAAFDNGWTFTGGQMWSLVTETKHGIDNRSEALPMTIDPQYTVGFSWARQYGVRLAKDFSNKAWLAVSLENPQATLTTHGNGFNFLIGSAGAGGGLYNSAITTCSTTTSTSATGTVSVLTACSPAATYSFNPSPDVIAKLALEPGFGHYEIFGVYSRFRDRVFPCAESTAAYTPCGTTITSPSAADAFNSSKTGGGIGVNMRWSFANKRVDFGLHGLTGRGVGRYGTSTLPDTSVRADGTLDLVRSYQGLATLEWHGPKMDVYMNVGTEYAGRAFDYDPNNLQFGATAGTPAYVGYGAGGPMALGGGFNNSGCFAEALPTNGAGNLPGSSKCTADTRALTEGTIGFWYRLYNGPKGRIQWGPQISYVDRAAWSGKGGLEPHGLDTMVFTSFRYYLP